jgi:FkbH-like protein
LAGDLYREDQVKLIEALTLIQDQRDRDGEPLSVLLACGFEALHLRTLLTAHLLQQFPHRPVKVDIGRYGDLAGTIEHAEDGSEAVAVVIEWGDLDPRLGLRGSGSWAPRALADIVSTADRAAARLRAAIEHLARRHVVALCTPTLPFPPCAHTPAAATSELEADLGAIVTGLTTWAVRQPRVRVVRAQALDHRSPAAERLDVASELRAGFPYRVAHADVVADLLARLIGDPAPKKGLITDLDDTVWRGLVGDVGVAGVTWDLTAGAHVHTLYQQLLLALAESGVLVGVASKNEPAAVEEALGRSDMVLTRHHLYPVHAGWGAKSEAVARILRAWNIAASDVVFVDDTPMELAEVAAAHPGLTCVRFPKDDPAAVWTTLERLRDLFGKATIGDEDRLRAASLQAAADAPPPGSGTDGFEAFLADAQAELTLDFRLDADDPRALELVNKTNQFTLNARRYTAGQWRALLARPGAFLVRVSYEDRFGPLGKIAVLAGRREGAALTVETWAMSCRAFSRRIEHQCLRQLAARFASAELVFDYAKTERNGPVQEFFRTLHGACPSGDRVRVASRALDAALPALHHTIKELAA